MRESLGTSPSCAGGLRHAMSNGQCVHVCRVSSARSAGVKLTIAEARPDLQGARVGAWEAAKAKLKPRVCVDGAVGHLVQSRAVDAVVVEAQRVAANGDAAGNIGTYMVGAPPAAHAARGADGFSAVTVLPRLYSWRRCANIITFPSTWSPP